MIIENYIQAINNMELFKEFTEKELIKIFKTNNYFIKKYKKSTIIHLQNEICNTMDIILSGRVSVQNIDKNGNILTISNFTSGDILAANLIFSNKNCYPMTVLAISDVIILHLNKELILQLCQTNIGFLKSLIKSISNKTITLTNKINSISLKSIRECIIDFLTYEYYLQNSNIIKLNMSKKDLAERFGIQRPSLSRELNKMRKDGLLEYDAKTITIKDMSIIT